MINATISVVLQIVVFSLIPFVVYLIRYKTAIGFFEYIGLKRSNQSANLLAVLLAILLGGPVILLTFLHPEFQEIMLHSKSMTGKFRQMGFSSSTLYQIVMAAIFKTALSEEIFFRGFLAKRLIAWLGFQTGNIIQALLFGAIHTAIFLAISYNAFFLTIIFIFPALGAYFKVYLNEKMAGGSIIPGWIAHGLGNVIAYGVIGFGVQPL